MTLLGQMMYEPLLLSSLLARAARQYGDVEIVSRQANGEVHRYTYRDCHFRSRQLAQALTAQAIVAGDRIGSLAWNGYRHMELYYGVTGIGAVCHTINPRLFPEQIAYIINHARDRVIFFDASFEDLIEKIAPLCSHVERWIVLSEADTIKTHAGATYGSYEALIADHSGSFDWPQFDELQAALLCYTSGTTGEPKGVLFSHRAIMLMALTSALPDSLALSTSETVAPIVPMFHVNAWGLPFSAPLVGAKLVFPGSKLDGESLCSLFEQEGVTLSAAVPTVWLGFVDYMQRTGKKSSTFKRAVVGGAACPEKLVSSMREIGVKTIAAWGMTELAPLGAINSSRAVAGASEIEPSTNMAKQGRALPGIDLKVIGSDGTELTWDGTSAGELMARGHWVAERYFGEDNSALRNGWFPTGDVATIDSHGFMQITDRSKDVIKSGGEWISSITLENIAISHPDVIGAACIGCAHPKWDERPLLVVVRRDGSKLTSTELLGFYNEKVANWWIPNDVVFVPELPLTATGKLQKRALRQIYEGHFIAANSQ